MTNRNSKELILSTLIDARAELEKITLPREAGLEQLTARDWLGYDDALRNVQLAISALEKVNISLEANELPPVPHTSKKGVLKKISEIKIDGEPDWSQRCKREVF